MTAPLTIFLPVRNGGAYVRQAVASVVAQSDPDWRLVVLENASTDDTVATVRAFDDPRIEIVPADRPLDIYENWHRPFELMRSGLPGNPLVTFIGHDDYFYPGFVAEAKGLAAAAPDATLYQTLFDLVDGEGKLIRPCRPVPRDETWMDLAAAMGWGIRDSVGTGYFCRADDYVKVGGMPYLPRILYADHLLWLRLTRLGFKRSGTASCCAYRFHADSTSNAVSVAKINDRMEAFAGFLAVLNDEFGAFADTDLGHATMTTWLGRELFVFDAAAVRGALTAENRARLDVARAQLIRLGGSAHPDHWAFQANPRLVRVLRRMKLQATYARARLRG